MSALWLLVVCLPQAQSTQDINHVLSEYSKAVTRLEERFRMVRGDGVFTREMGEPSGHISRDRISFAQNRELWKFSRERLDDTPNRGPFESVRVWNRSMAFVFHREQEDSSPLLKGVMRTPEELIETNIDDTWDGFVGQSLASPYSIWGRSVAKIMADPSFRIQGISEVERDSKRFLKLDFRYEYLSQQPPQKAIWTVALLVCPEDGWVIHEYEFNQRYPELVDNPGRNYWGHVVYGPKQDGFPTLRHVTVVEGKRTALGARPFRRFFDFDDFRFESVPEREFTLAFFGLPELDRPVTRAQSHTGFWIIAIAIALMVVAMTLKRYSARMSPK